jgi:hypothetical protein
LHFSHYCFLISAPTTGQEVGSPDFKPALGSDDTKHFGAAGRTKALNGMTAVFHRDRFRGLYLPFGAAFQTVGLHFSRLFSKLFWRPLPLFLFEQGF